MNQIRDNYYKINIADIKEHLIDGIQNYKIVIATLFRHFEWGKYQKFHCAMYIEIQ